MDLRIINVSINRPNRLIISTSSPIRCYRCNESNHFTRNCPNFLKVSNATRPLTNPQDKLYRIDGARAVELIIRILGKPVRFLADTDVGINVMKRLYTDGHKINRNVRKLTGISHLILTTTENCEIDCDIRTYIFAIVGWLSDWTRWRNRTILPARWEFSSRCETKDYNIPRRVHRPWIKLSTFIMTMGA